MCRARFVCRFRRGTACRRAGCHARGVNGSSPCRRGRRVASGAGAAAAPESKTDVNGSVDDAFVQVAPAEEEPGSHAGASADPAGHQPGHRFRTGQEVMYHPPKRGEEEMLTRVRVMAQLQGLQSRCTQAQGRLTAQGEVEKAMDSDSPEILEMVLKRSQQQVSS